MGHNGNSATCQRGNDEFETEASLAHQTLSNMPVTIFF